MTQLWRSFGYLVPVAAVAGTALGLGVLVGSWARRSFAPTWGALGAACGSALLAVWALCFAALTLWPASSVGGVDLVPLRELRHYAHAVSVQVPLAQVGGNLVLYGALGMLLAARTSWRVRRVLAVGIVVAVADEGLQWLLGSGRAVTTDDVIVGAVGVALGAAVVVAGRAVVRRRLGAVGPASGEPVGADRMALGAGAGQRWR